MSLVLWTVLALTAACGGDDDDDDGAGAGGDSGKGGAGASGSSGSVAAGRGGAGSGATGGSGGTGGTAGTSGTGGTGGTGGNQTMNPAACPATAPAPDTACNMLDLECMYGAMECDCDEQGGAMALSWDCTTGGAGMMQMCPAAEPGSGTACTEGRGECEFGSKICDCNDDAWACWDPAVDCPAMPPAADSACSPVGMECEYGDGECDCEDTGWECDDDIGGMPDAGAGT